MGAATAEASKGMVCAVRALRGQLGSVKAGKCLAVKGK